MSYTSCVIQTNQHSFITVNHERHPQRRDGIVLEIDLYTKY